MTAVFLMVQSLQLKCMFKVYMFCLQFRSLKILSYSIIITLTFSFPGKLTEHSCYFPSLFGLHFPRLYFWSWLLVFKPTTYWSRPQWNGKCFLFLCSKWQTYPCIHMWVIICRHCIHGRYLFFVIKFYLYAEIYTQEEYCVFFQQDQHHEDQTWLPVQQIWLVQWLLRVSASGPRNHRQVSEVSLPKKSVVFCGTATFSSKLKLKLLLCYNTRDATLGLQSLSVLWNLFQNCQTFAENEKKKLI